MKFRHSAVKPSHDFTSYPIQDQLLLYGQFVVTLFVQEYVYFVLSFSRHFYAKKKKTHTFTFLFL